MSNLELIDAYLRDKLDSESKVRFEQEMEADDQLKQEFRFQQEIVEGIKEARRMELKAMLDNVAIGDGSGGSAALFSKLISAAVVIGIVGWGIYSLTDPGEEQEYMPVSEQNESVDELIALEETLKHEIAEETETVGQEVTEQEEDLEETTTAITNETLETSDDQAVIVEPEINRPDAIVSFEGDGEEHDSVQAPGSVQMDSKEEDNPTIEVAVDNTRKKFTFHYQFKEGKLFLYGDFSSDLYEILEFNTNGERSIFLYYKGKYYDLDENNQKIVELKAVKDKTVISKLEAARING